MSNNTDHTHPVARIASLSFISSILLCIVYVYVRMYCISVCMVFIYMYMYYNAITLCYRCTDEAQKAKTLGC